MKSKTPKKPPARIRHQVLAAMLSEAGRQAVKIIGYVAVAIIIQHMGGPLGPELILV